MYYYREDLGFLRPSIHKNIPEDAVEVTDEEHVRLMEGQCDGYSIVCGDDGRPYLKEPYTPEPNYEKDAREKRNFLLRESDWSQAGDVPEKIRESYKVYRQALRDITKQEGFPENIEWPKKPEKV